MRPENKKRVLYAAVAAIVLFTSIWYIYHTFTSYPYGIRVRFDPYQNQAIVQQLDQDGPAYAAGLRVGDVILSVNDYTMNVLDPDCRESFVRELRSGSLNMLISRDGDEKTFMIEGGSIEIRAHFYAFLAISILYILMGTWVFFSRPNYGAASAWGFFALLMGGFVVQLGTVRPASVESFYLIISILVAGQFIFSAAAGLHFALIFPKPGSLARKRWVIPTLYVIPACIHFLIALLLSINYFFEGYWQNLAYIPSIIGVFIASYFIIYFGLTIIVLVRSYLGTIERSEKRRMRAIIFGTSIPLAILMFISILDGLFNIIIPYPSFIVAIALASLPITYFYAIVRHRAMQVTLILRSGLIYSLVTGAVLILTGLGFIAVFGIMLLLQDVLPSLGEDGGTFYRLVTNEDMQKFMIAVWSVAIGATFGGIKRKVQRFVDRQFYREKYSYRQAVKKLAQILELTHDRNRLMDIVLENADEMVHPKSAAILMIKDSGTAVVEKAIPEAMEGITLKPDSASALEHVFDGKISFLGMRELSEGVVEDAELLHASFMRLSADICVPLRGENCILGFLLLGKKRSDTVYNLEEIELIQLLADQASHGIIHINLASEAAEKEKLRKELEIGRRMQQSLLPFSTPKLKGLEIAAINIPAMEVGGDFYTFVEYNPSKLGVIAGDIIGKGVAGAVKMASTISTMQLIAEESNSAAEVMQRLNRFLVRNTEDRSFAAAMFATVDLLRNEFRWSNGGFPDPVIIPAEGNVRYLENEEYPLPPGCSPHSVYLEHSVKLKTGDTIVLVSDGVIETRSIDDDEKEFGFDRLLTFFQENRYRGLNELLEVLKNEVYDLRGSNHLEDDLTVVALRLE